MHAIHEIFPAVKYFPWTSWGFELNPSTLFEAKTFTLESGNPFVHPNKEPNMMSDYLSNGPFFIPIRFNKLQNKLVWFYIFAWIFKGKFQKVKNTTS